MIDITFLECLMILSLTYIGMFLSGPFGIFSRIRNILILNTFVGSLFYKLFSCFFCFGFYSGIMTYFVMRQETNLLHAFAFGLAGSMLSLGLHVIFTNLDAEKEEDVF